MFLFGEDEKKKPSNKATRREEEEQEKLPQYKINMANKKNVKRIKIFYVITIFYMSYMC